MTIVVHGNRDIPLSWWFGNRDGLRVVLLSCSNGHKGTLVDHAIASDGTVMPSVICGWDGCEFHDYVRLDGWPTVPQPVFPLHMSST